MADKNITPIVQRKRDSSLDIAKAFLISMLILHHTIDMSGGLDNSVFLAIAKMQRPLILCYFMPAFFFITGMCSNFKKDFRPFLISQIKCLLLPALTFTFIFDFSPTQPLHAFTRMFTFLMMGGAYWFMLTLFLSKMIYYVVVKHIEKKMVIFLIFLSLSFCGIALNQLDLAPNIFRTYHVLDLSIFVALGNLIGKNIERKKFIVPSAVLYLAVTVFYSMMGVDLPYVTSTIGTSIVEWPIHLILAFAGTIIIIFLSRLIKSETLLEYIGRNSLFIYMIQGAFISTNLKFYIPYLETSSIAKSVVIIIFIYITVTSVGLLTSYFFNKKYLKYLVGKF